MAEALAVVRLVLVAFNVVALLMGVVVGVMTAFTHLTTDRSPGRGVDGLLGDLMGFFFFGVSAVVGLPSALTLVGLIGGRGLAWLGELGGILWLGSAAVVFEIMPILSYEHRLRWRRVALALAVQGVAVIIMFFGRGYWPG